MHKCSFFRGYRRGQGAFPGEGMETAKNACQFPLPPSLPAAVSKVQRNPPIYWIKSGGTARDPTDLVEPPGQLSTICANWKMIFLK